MMSHGFMAPIGALDEELRIFEGWQLCNGKVFLLVFGEDTERAKYSNVGYVCVGRYIYMFEMH